MSSLRFVCHLLTSLYEGSAILRWLVVRAGIPIGGYSVTVATKVVSPV